MRTKLTLTTPAAALGRILDQLDRELIEASDEDILEAARDLGMNPMMKGSAAFLGLQFLSFAEFLESDALRSLLADRAALNAVAPQSESKRKLARAKPVRSVERKDSADK
jgi:hypothetical protein